MHDILNRRRSVGGGSVDKEEAGRSVVIGD